MEIKHTAIAGTLESSDIQIMLSKGTNGIEFNLESDVIKLYGDQIKQVITDVINSYEIKDIKVKVVDKGALDCVIKARTLTAVQRALDLVEPNWEVL